MKFYYIEIYHFPPLPLIVFKPYMFIPLPLPAPLPIPGGGLDPSNLPAASA